MDFDVAKNMTKESMDYDAEKYTTLWTNIADNHKICPWSAAKNEIS